MAEPPPAPSANMTVTIAVPILANIFQSVQNIEREVTNLRADFSTRLEALEAQLARQSTIQSPLHLTANLSHEIADNTISRHENSVHQEEDRIDYASLHVQINDRFRRDGHAHTQQDDIVNQDNVLIRAQEDNIVQNHEDLVTHTQQDDVTLTQQDDVTHTQQDNVTHTQQDENITHTQEENSAHENAVTHTHTHEDKESLAREDGQSVIASSSPSVDLGITVAAKPVVPAPAAANAAAGVATASGRKKRKRTIHDAPAHIDRSGFMIRSSNAKLAENRGGEARGPSRSESPFDNSNDGHDSSEDTDELPPKAPARTQSSQSTSKPPNVRRRQPKAEEAGLDRFVAPKEESFTISQYGRIRNQTQRPPGFVATPDFKKVNQKSK